MKVHKVVWILLALVFSLLVGTAIAASGGHDEEPSPWTAYMIAWRVVNTVALLALLVYFLKKPLVTFFSERTAQIGKDLDGAKGEREKAERTLKEYEQKIAGMEQELEKMRAELKKAADAESEKVVANAERMAEGIIEAARIAAEQEVRKAKAELQNEAVELAVQTAETLIREKMSAGDQKKIVEDYLVKVEGMK